ncbi:MAG: hypothetical protein BEN18_00725 [Epulopiscium sp. Nuni2H_MBin001]|nr:MAG: hypothetical protein BEN18_00725 [Epulopiscium sp. Nuni2H_MBin001]
MKKWQIALLASIMATTIQATEPAPDSVGEVITQVQAKLERQLININNKVEQWEVLTYNGTTYLPVRQLAHMYKSSVAFKDGTLYLSSIMPPNIEPAPTVSDGVAVENSYVGIENAKEIVLHHANIRGQDAKFSKVDLVSKHDLFIYELEFKVGQVVYTYQVEATTGRVMSCNKSE